MAEPRLDSMRTNQDKAGDVKAQLRCLSLSTFIKNGSTSVSVRSPHAEHVRARTHTRVHAPAYVLEYDGGTTVQSQLCLNVNEAASSVA